MKSQPILHNWQFYRGIPDRFRSPELRTVDLPHDFSISTDPEPDTPGAAALGFYKGGVGTYQKHFFVPAEWEGERVCVRFDGVYHNATVNVNGSKVAFHPYGYTPFVVDLTHRVLFGQENRLEVIVNADATPNCRWYSGAGIYRAVELLHGPQCRIAPWGLYLRTETFVDNDALVIAEVNVRNDGPLPVRRHVTVTLTDADGIKTQARGMVWVPAGETATARIRFVVRDVRRWSVEDPQCYAAEALLWDGDAIVDSEQCRFGIRTITVDAVHGLRINDQSIKLKGGCLHHVTSALGAADHIEQSRRLLIQHKQAGYNALRCAHNPPSAQFLDLCDEIGILLIDEAFDGWHIAKTLHGYADHFEDWWERDLEAMVRRDRSHPSVLFWSTGNEVYERAGCGDGYLWAQRLAAKVRSLDTSRPVLHGLCSLWNGLDDVDQAAELAVKQQNNSHLQNSDSNYTHSIWADRTEGIAAPVDVVGYNYLDDRYESDHELFPDRVICGTESFPMQIDRIWDLVEKLDYVLGDFVWTSADYIGEAGIGCCVYEDPESEFIPLPDHTKREYPWRVANDADWDLCGFERPQLAFRRIVWGSDETYLAVRDPANYGKREKMSGWAWPIVSNNWTWLGYEGRPIQVDVYSAGDEVELLCNGASCGRTSTEHHTAKFELTYVPGTLEAISYRNGEKLSSQKIETAGEAVQIGILPEQTQASSAERGLIYAAIELQDKWGRRVPTAKVKLTARVTGAAKLVTLYSADPMTTENYAGGTFTTYDGRALAILRAGSEPGEATLKVQAEGYPEASYTFQINI